MHVQSNSTVLPLHIHFKFEMLSQMFVIRAANGHLDQCMNAAATSAFGVFPLHWEHCSLARTAHVCCAASSAEGGGVSVCLASMSPSRLNKWAQRGGLAEGAEPCSCTVICANGGPLAEWSSGYVTHKEDRLCLRLPQVLFRLNGEKGFWERDVCRPIGREERFLLSPQGLRSYTCTAFHCRFFLTKLHTGYLSMYGFA